MKQILKDQRGVAMVAELALVAAVLVLVGIAGWRYYDAKYVSTASTGAPAVQPVPAGGDTTPNGKVANAANALDAEATAEASDATQENASVGQIDSTGADASSVAGAYNESQF